MTTAVVTAPVHVRTAGAYDRVFFSSIAILMALIVLIGFAPTYYLKGVRGGPMLTISGLPFTRLVHVHALMFTAWVALFIVQTALVARRSVRAHRRLGIAGGLLAFGMVAMGTATAIDGARQGTAPPGIDPLVFLAVPLFDMLCFAGFVSAALLLRAKKAAHKRLMLLAYVSIMGAATARLPGVLPLGPLVFYGLAFVFMGAGAIYDLIALGRVHKAYLWGGAVLVTSVPLRLIVSGTDTWRAFAELVTR
jgi:hypothetical protein